MEKDLVPEENKSYVQEKINADPLNTLVEAEASCYVTLNLAPEIEEEAQEKEHIEDFTMESKSKKLDSPQNELVH